MGVEIVSLAKTKEFLDSLNPDKLKWACEQVYWWQHNDSGSFNCKLFELMAKADARNGAKLFAAFPELTAAYTLWVTEENFFEKYCAELIIDEDSGGYF